MEEVISVFAVGVGGVGGEWEGGRQTLIDAARTSGPDWKHFNAQTSVTIEALSTIWDQLKAP